MTSPSDPHTITFIFSRFTFSPLLSNALLHFKNLFFRSSVVSLITTKSSVYKTSFIKPSLAFSVTISVTIANRYLMYANFLMKKQLNNCKCRKNFVKSCLVKMKENKLLCFCKVELCCYSLQQQSIYNRTQQIGLEKVILLWKYWQLTIKCFDRTNCFQFLYRGRGKGACAMLEAGFYYFINIHFYEFSECLFILFLSLTAFLYLLFNINISLHLEDLFIWALFFSQ